MKKLILIFVIIAALGVSMTYADSDRGVSSIKAISGNALNLKSYNEAKLELEKEKDNYEIAKNEWLLEKQKYLDAKKLNSTLNNTNEMALVIEKGKTFLNRTVSRMISHLELIKSKVAEHKVLTDEEKANITAQLDSDIANLTALQADVQNVTTIQQLKDVNQKIIIEWRNAQKGIARAVGLDLTERADNILKNRDNYSAAIQKYIDALKSRGANTTDLNKLLADYNNQMDLASQSVATARQDFIAGDIKAGNDALKDAKEHLKDASETLRELAKKMKEGVKEFVQAKRNQTKDRIAALKEERRELKASAAANKSTA